MHQGVGKLLSDMPRMGLHLRGMTDPQALALEQGPKGVLHQRPGVARGHGTPNAARPEGQGGGSQETCTWHPPPTLSDRLAQPALKLLEALECGSLCWLGSWACAPLPPPTKAGPRLSRVQKKGAQAHRRAGGMLPNGSSHPSWVTGLRGR